MKVDVNYKEILTSLKDCQEYQFPDLAIKLHCVVPPDEERYFLIATLEGKPVHASDFYPEDVPLRTALQEWVMELVSVAIGQYMRKYPSVSLGKIDTNMD